MTHWLASVRSCTIIGVVAATAALSHDARAHDPGLSGSVVKVTGNQIAWHDSFAWKDIDRLVKLDANGDGRIEDGELVARRKELAELGAAMFSVRIDGTLAPQLSTVAKLGTDGEGDIIFISVYASPRAVGPANLAVTFKGLDKFASGHRHILEVQDETGKAVLRDLLGRGDVDADVSFPSAAVQTDSGAKLGATEAYPASASSTPFPRFVVLGAEHILFGYDHVLFLVAIVLACQSLRTLVACITLFTVAHSLTLILASLGVVHVSAGVVEPIIAGSIVAVALLHLLAPGLTRYLPALTFVFGLIHGLGFAGSIAPVLAAGTGGQAGLVVSLAGFNVGVELGQLLLVLLLMPLLQLAARRSPSFRMRLQPAACVVIALLGTYWMFERIFL